MIRFKPSYHELMAHVASTVSNHFKKADASPIIGDFGAGTGELSIRLAKALPEAEIHALEVNEGFHARMQDKVSGIANIQPQLANVEDTLFVDEYLDAACMIHVLNLTKKAKQGVALERIAKQLKTGGLLVIADIGRVIDIKKHGLEILKCAWKEQGFSGLISVYLNNRESSRQNKEFVRFQKSPDYPSHNLKAFCDLIESKGFEILESRDDFYLGADDFVVAKKITSITSA